MNIPTCPTCRQPRPTALRDEVMTGARPKADQRLADAIAAAPTTKPTHRWYKHPGLAGVWLFHDECATGGRYCKPGSEERESRSDEYGLLAGTVPITYLRAREILGSAWPASWPQTDPDAPIAETLDDLNIRFSDPNAVPDNGQSRRTGAATAAILNRNGAGACASAGTDADPSGAKDARLRAEAATDSAIADLELPDVARLELEYFIMRERIAWTNERAACEIAAIRELAERVIQ